MKKYIVQGFIWAISVVVYIICVSGAMINAPKLFGADPGFLSFATFLMLFVLSVAVVGLLLFGRPTFLYFAGLKQEALTLMASTIGWFFVLTMCGVLVRIFSL